MGDVRFCEVDDILAVLRCFLLDFRGGALSCNDAGRLKKKSFVSESTHGAMQCEKVARAGWFESASTVR